MTGAGTLRVGPVESRPLLPHPGVFWRGCRFEPGAAERLTCDAPGGPVAVTLPPGFGSAVDTRRSEFLAGRLCAALALRALGAPEQVGRRGRAPLWPDGVVGSISHARGRAVAVASRDLAALGVDCEAVMTAQTAAEISPMVLTAQERALRPAGWSPAFFCTVAFCAKEAVYKSVSAQLDRIPDFAEACIIAIGPFTAKLRFQGRDICVAHGRDGEFCVAMAAYARGGSPMFNPGL